MASAPMAKDERQQAGGLSITHRYLLNLFLAPLGNPFLISAHGSLRHSSDITTPAGHCTSVRGAHAGWLELFIFGGNR